MRYNRFPHFLGLCAALAAAAASGSAPAQQAGSSDAERTAEYANAQEYADCMALAMRVPEDALSSAEAWEQRGGGDPARHCIAVALIGMGQFAEAAERMERLAASMPADNAALAAQALVQAGVAWQSIDMYERALAARAAALRLAPDDVGIFVDRSASQFGLGHCWEAIDDLNEAHQRAPERVDVLVLRSSAYRCVEAFDLADDDIARALLLKPDDSEALLERGSIRYATGDPGGARADWLQVARQAAGTPAADVAQMNLERLDLNSQ